MAQPQAEIHVFLPVLIAGAEATHRLQVGPPDEEAGGTERGHVADRAGPRAQGVLAGPGRHGDRDAVLHPEVDPAVLQGEIGELHAGPHVTGVARIDQASSDSRHARLRNRLDQVPQPVAGDRLDVVVQEQDELATAGCQSLVVGLRERGVLGIGK